jgi:ribosomal protein S18 acetylase RimI-like enzyme
MEDHKISVRKGLPGDVDAFTSLMLTAGKLLPVMYGRKTAQMLHFLFLQPDNIYSYENTHFAEYDGQVAGALLGYTVENSMMQQKRTRELMIAFLKFNFVWIIGKIKKVHNYFGEADDDSYYISHIATDLQFRKKGVGQALISTSVKEARCAGKKKIVLDVLAENMNAIGVYEKFGFRQEGNRGKLLLNSQSFEYIKMVYYIVD